MEADPGDDASFAIAQLACPNAKVQALPKTPPGPKELPSDEPDETPKPAATPPGAVSLGPLRAFVVPDKPSPVDPLLKANQKNRRARLMLAYADKAKKDWPAVIKDAKEGLALKPDDPQFLKLEADAENRLKLCQEAFQTAGRAVAVDPTDATAYALKAWALGCLGDRAGMSVIWL